MTSDRPAFLPRRSKGTPSGGWRRAFSLPFWQASKFNLRYASELGETGGEIKSRRKTYSIEVKFKERRGNHERSAGAGGNEKGRVYFDVGRQARKVGRERAALCGLGNVSPEGFTGGPQSDLCVADQRMVRSDHSTLG